jgi:hypothetical protein
MIERVARVAFWLSGASLGILIGLWLVPTDKDVTRIDVVTNSVAICNHLGGDIEAYTYVVDGITYQDFICEDVDK